ncbi:MAG: tripartite tricarboxylate transporter substrate binding protein [Betaproteobacteria bacterium]|nr:tripartite tricarboxylate transporter substrate binding protein [Betaproteobacteria bacterium]
MTGFRARAAVGAGTCIGAYLLLAGYPVAAQPAWKPEKSVEIVVTCQPGCGPDIAARTIQRIWQDQRILEVPSVVLNKPGGGGAVAYGYLHQRPGDAHSIVLSGAGAVVNAILGRGVGYKDLTALAMMAAEYVGVAVRADSSIQSGRELIDTLKQDSAALTFGVANSLGNANHQAVALALKVQGIHPGKAKTVVFQSGANAITALLGGHVQVVPASVGLWVGPRKSGQVRLIAVTSPKRLGGEFADVPTWREQGADAVVSVWRMITAPPELSQAQIAFWQDALRRTTRTQEWKRDLERNYQSDEFMAGNELNEALDALHEQLKVLLTDLELTKRRGKGAAGAK